MTPELKAALDDYDRATKRAVLGAKVKELRASGTRVTEIRETLDDLGIPCRVRLMAGENVAWSYDRRPEGGAPAQPPPRSHVVVVGAGWPDDDAGGGSRHGGRSGF